MQAVPDVPAYLYTMAWVALLAISVFYIVVGIALRWRPNRSIHVTRYEPPEGITPAIAAFLVESGRCERSFAAALISLAARQHLKILQKGDTVTLEKLREADAQLPLEESGIFSFLFTNGVDNYSFNAADSFRLLACYREFQAAIHNVVSGEWMSTHIVIWLVGLCYSLTVLEPVVFAMPRLGNGMPLASLGFAGLLILVGSTCFIAALRVWPALLRKLSTFLPGSRRPRRPLNMNDSIPLFLTVTALFGFVLLSVVTSTKVAGLLAAALAMNVFSWHLMNAPTSGGRKALAELAAFREFLSRTDADRLGRQNEPGRTPRTLGLFSAYAVALGVECGWGEEFAATILDLVQVDEAYSPPISLPEPDNSPVTLNLFDRKK
jgi:hypothetical protein